MAKTSTKSSSIRRIQISHCHTPKLVLVQISHNFILLSYNTLLIKSVFLLGEFACLKAAEQL